MQRSEWSRRRFLRLSAAVGAGVVVAACQPKVVEVEKVVEKEVTKVVKEVVKETVVVEGTPQVVEKVVEKQITVAPAPKEVVTLRPSTFMGSAEGYMEPRSQAFDDVRADVKVEPILYPRAEYTTKILALAASGDAPDIIWGAIYGGGYINLALKGVVIPLDELASAAGVSFDEWFKAAIDVGSWNGNCYALPNMSTPGSVTLYFNKSMFDQEGLSYPTLESDLSEVVDMASKLSIKEMANKRFGYNVGTAYVPLNPQMRTFGAEFMTVDGKTVTLDSEEGVACIQWIQDMMWKDQIHPTASDLTGSNDRKMFAAGKLAMTVTTLSFLHDVDEMSTEPFDWDLTLIPMKSDVGQRGSCIAAHHLGISKDCQHQEEAWDLLYYFCNHETGVEKVLRGWGNPGARPDCWGDPLVQAIHPSYASHYEVLKNCGLHILPWNCHGPELMDVIANGLGAVWSNEMPAEQGVQETADSMRDVIAKAPVGE